MTVNEASDGPAALAGDLRACDDGWGGPSSGQQEPSHAAGPLVLELTIAGTEPLRGTVRATGGESGISFHGWIDLMAAISEIKQART